jgi:hypothetical protein
MEIDEDIISLDILLFVVVAAFNIQAPSIFDVKVIAFDWV